MLYSFSPHVGSSQLNEQFMMVLRYRVYEESMMDEAILRPLGGKDFYVVFVLFGRKMQLLNGGKLFLC